MKAMFFITVAAMMTMGWLGGFVSTAEQGRKEAEETRAAKESEESLTVRWDGPKKMFCESKIFRVGNQRVCLLVSK